MAKNKNDTKKDENVIDKRIKKVGKGIQKLTGNT